MRPSSIDQFERFFLGSLVIGVVNAAVSYSASMRLLEADPAVAQAGMGSGFFISMMVFSFAIPLLLWFFIARRASNVAKWILVVLTAIGLVVMVLALPVMMQQGTLALVLGLATTALQLVAISFLFRRDAVDWLSSAGAKGPVDPATFD